MNATIKSFVMPEVIVKFSNMSIDITKRTFTMDVATKAKGKRSFISENVSGTISSEIADFFSLKRHDQIKIAADNEQGFIWKKTGTSSTSFERMLKHMGHEFVPGILKTMVFESANDSDNRVLNPFKLIRYAERNTLQLVNIAPKKKTEIIDPETGLTKEHYSQKWFKDGDKMRPQFFAPKYYRRLVVETIVPVEAVA